MAKKRVLTPELLAKLAALLEEADGDTPTRPRKKAKRRTPKFLRDDEVAALLGAVVGERDRLICLLGLYGGLRVSEMTKLGAEDVDLSGGLLELRQAKGNKDRTVPLHPMLAVALTEWLQRQRSGLVFPSSRTGRALTTRAVQLLVSLAGKRAGLVRRVTPHTLRHTFACNLLRRGADLLEIKDLLGHSSVATTQIYAVAMPERLRGAVEAL